MPHPINLLIDRTVFFDKSIGESLYFYGGISLKHRITELGLSLTGDLLARLDADNMLTLPDAADLAMPPAERVYTDMPAQSRLARALQDHATSSAEPTHGLAWSVLGKWIVDSNFASMHRRLYFMSTNWGVDIPIDMYQREIWPAFRDHPLGDTLNIYRYDSSAVEIEKFLSDMQPRDLNFFCYRDFYRQSSSNHASQLTPTLNQTYANTDWVHGDLIDLLLMTKLTKSRNYHLFRAERLLDIHPGSVLAMTAKINYDKLVSDEQIELYEQQHGDQYILLGALAYRHRINERYDEALKYLNRRLEQVEDVSTLNRIAKIYEKQGDDDRWLETKLQILDVPDHGLSHSSVLIEIAERFMESGRFEEAVQYAEMSAESGSASAYEIAAFANEALGRFDKAEDWWRQKSQRYSSSQSHWAVFCKRAGTDVPLAAKRLAIERYMNRIQGDNLTRMWHALRIAVALDMPHDALELCVELSAPNKAWRKFRYGLAALRIAKIHGLGKDAQRAALTTAIEGLQHKDYNRLTPLRWGLEEAVRRLDRGGPLLDKVASDAIEELVEDQNQWTRRIVFSTLGVFAETSDRQTDAIRLYTKMFDDIEFDDDFMDPGITTAWNGLVRLGENPYEALGWPALHSSLAK